MIKLNNSIIDVIRMNKASLVVRIDGEYYYNRCTGHRSEMV